MPPPSRNLLEFSGVSSVRFHKVNQVISVIVSQVRSLGKELGMIRVVEDKTMDTLSFWTTIVSRFWTTSSLPISCFWARSSWKFGSLQCCDAKYRQSSFSTWHLAAEGVQEKDASTLRDYIINGVSCILYKNRSTWECQTIIRRKYSYKKMSIKEPEWSHLLHWHVVLRQRREELEPDRRICCLVIKIGNINAGF